MKLKQTWIVITISIGFSILSNAQQEPRSAFFWNNYMHTNPAMTGAIYQHQANVQWRNQWVNTNGAPTTLWANYAMKLDSINSGVGVSYEYDVIGLNRSHTALVSYAYHLPIKKMYLSFGASAGIKTLKFDGSDLVFSTPVPAFETRNYNPVFQCDLGVALHAERWNVGVSVTQLNGAKFKDPYLPYKNAAHLWVFADYTFLLGEKWKLTPRLQSYSDGKTLCSTLAAVATWKERLWFGGTASVPVNQGSYNIGPMIGYDIAGKFRLGYAYEFRIENYTPNNSSIGNDGTHEIILSYQLR